MNNQSKVILSQMLYADGRILHSTFLGGVDIKIARIWKLCRDKKFFYLMDNTENFYFVILDQS